MIIVTFINTEDNALWLTHSSLVFNGVDEAFAWLERHNYENEHGRYVWKKVSPNVTWRALVTDVSSVHNPNNAGFICNIDNI